VDIVKLSIARPVGVTVAVILVVMFGLIGLGAIPIQLTPTVDRPIITVTTNWTGRSPQEVVDEITKEQEERLKNVANLRSMTSVSSEGQATITLEFNLGAQISRALQEVSDSLRQVPAYPEEVDEPTIVVADGASENAIAWIILDLDPKEKHKHPDFDITTLFDRLDKDVKPRLERINGVAQINIYGGREREVQVRIDPEALAQRGISPGEVIVALRGENRNVSAGSLAEGKRDYRVRVVGRYEQPWQVLDTIITYRDGMPVYIRDVADVVQDHQKQRGFVRSLGNPSIAINAIRQSNANVVEVMKDLRAELEYIRAEVVPGLHPTVGPDLRLRQVYDETIYIDSAVKLVQQNLWIGGLIAGAVLLIFLRSFVSTGVIALAIPISVIGTFLVLLGMGRTLNVISLAGLAFAVGMVVDNAIVVLENIFRRLQMGESPMIAAERGGREVWGAILASTLTTAAVFIPVLTIREEAGQLFGDIALAVVASVALSLIVSITVIPAACSRWMREYKPAERGRLRKQFDSLFGLTVPLAAAVSFLAATIKWSITSWRGYTVRPAIIVFMTAASLLLAARLAPPLDYLPAGNRNLVFGGLLIPPGLSLEQRSDIAQRIERQIQPFMEARADDPVSMAALPPIPRHGGTAWFDPVPIDNFFIGAFGDGMFCGGTSQIDDVVIPIGQLISNAMGSIPDSFGGASQASIFGRGVGGGNTIDIEISGFNLDRVRDAAGMMVGIAFGKYGGFSVSPDPANFNLQQQEVQLRLNTYGRELGITTSDLGIAVRGLVDGALAGEYLLDGESVDLVILPRADRIGYREQLAAIPIATPMGRTIPLDSVVDFSEALAPQAIRRIEELPSVTIRIRPPQGVPLQQVMEEIRSEIIEPARLAGLLDSSMRVRLEGSAAKLDEVRGSLFGTPLENAQDTRPWQHVLTTIAGVLAVSGIGVGLFVVYRAIRRKDIRSAYGGPGVLLLGVTLAGLFFAVGDQPELITARFVWALLVTYLLMAALFESFLYPFVIMFSVPLAVVGGFAGLAIVHAWSLTDPTKAPQQLDVLTMLGFVILIGIVVNNAILLVHQARLFILGDQVTNLAPMSAPVAIAEAARTRVRPIFMSTLTSVGGMMPLVLIPGAGSEMYRGLGSVVIGGLLVSTLFTLLLVPLLLSLVIDMHAGLVRALSSDLGSKKAATSAATTGAKTKATSQDVPTETSTRTKAVKPPGVNGTSQDNRPKPATDTPPERIDA